MFPIFFSRNVFPEERVITPGGFMAARYTTGHMIYETATGMQTEGRGVDPKDIHNQKTSLMERQETSQKVKILKVVPI